MPRVPSTFGEDAFGQRAEAAARFFGTAPLILLAQTRQADRDKEALDQLEAHREEVMAHMQQREAAIKSETEGLKVLIEANTALTEEDKALTEKIEALTREIHARLPPG